jgi:hypothetical protein
MSQKIILVSEFDLDKLCYKNSNRKKIINIKYMGDIKPVKFLLQTPILQIKEIITKKNGKLLLILKLSHLNYDKQVSDFYNMIISLENHIESTVCKEHSENTNTNVTPCLISHKNEILINLEIDDDYTCFNEVNHEISIDEILPGQYIKGILELKGIDFKECDNKCVNESDKFDKNTAFNLNWQLFQMKKVNSIYKLSNYSFKNISDSESSCSSETTDDSD